MEIQVKQHHEEIEKSRMEASKTPGTWILEKGNVMRGKISLLKEKKRHTKCNPVTLLLLVQKNQLQKIFKNELAIRRY